MATEATLLKLSMNGELLAEMPIVVYDQANAWKVFGAVFAAMSPQIVGEFYEAVRIACDPELLKNADKIGFTVDLQTKPRADILIPQTKASPADFHIKALPNGH